MKHIMSRLLAFLVFAVLGSVSAPLAAQDDETPYWVSLRADEVYMRVGPSIDYKIDWVYRRKGLPMRVVRVLDGWRLVQDPDGAQGWIAQRLLSRARSALVVGDEPAPMYERPDMSSKLRWKLEPGNVGQLGECMPGWCEFDVGGRKGFVEANKLWGAGRP